jgi:hypothetical protein
VLVAIGAAFLGLGGTQATSTAGSSVWSNTWFDAGFVLLLLGGLSALVLPFLLRTEPQVAVLPGAESTRVPALAPAPAARDASGQLAVLPAFTVRSPERPQGLGIGLRQGLVIEAHGGLAIRTISLGVDPEVPGIYVALDPYESETLEPSQTLNVEARYLPAGDPRRANDTLVRWSPTLLVMSFVDAHNRFWKLHQKVELGMAGVRLIDEPHLTRG